MTSVCIEHFNGQEISLKVPTSKSYGHRALIAASLAKGISSIQNLSDNQDIQATMACLRGLGVSFRQDGTQTFVQSNFHLQDKLVLDCHESASTLRFLIPLALTGNSPIEFTGTKRLLERGQMVYEKLAKEKDFLFQKEAYSILVKGPIQAGHYVVDGGISSQFITGLLFALPLLDGNSSLEIKGKLVSKDYVEMTLDMLRLAKIKVEKQGNCYFIEGNQNYQAFDYGVEGDYSSAAFLFALAFLQNKDIHIENLNSHSKQADFKIIEFLKQLETRQASFFDVEDCPDLAPILMAVASQLEGRSHFKNIHRLRMKESDRVQAMKEELEKLGIEMEVYANDAFITGGRLKPNQVLYGHQDHRIVMALSVLATLTNHTMIQGSEAVQKSYPQFFNDLKKLGVRVEEKE
ncbi:3-phosphoshikimate 1-carboxyvinyltransferase [Bulleidia sp. zg-1006]|uniref:3-phosphoshikimate 1-carboxyvinyltransferase n=1 Tax=Bulleidia sp. zg-1006 TaxID=2806552 RepID=UPI0019399583|nr:3-phosphoshikimate 1-carboxyvinyltransferase [Bulleidia sp. zg-1006]QRG86284.1 3-phosphoshikimate 1-carboxyvinyltransferase [Bulleidia sp. zg-1006]